MDGGGTSEEDRKFLIGSTMPDQERANLVRFLDKNSDVFAWTPYDLPGVKARVMCHKLHIDPNFKPVKQKPRRMSPEKA